jgi:hypothetical protein
MSAVYNPEADTMAEIERLEMESKQIRRRIDTSRNEEDQRVLRRQLADLKDEIARLQARLP